MLDRKGRASMPTQEERLSALEQTVTVLNRGIWDINHNETILLGMATKQGENIQGMMASLATLTEHFSTLEGRIDTLEGRLGAFEQNVTNRFGTLEQSVNSRFEGQDQKFEAQDRKLDQIVLLLNTLISKPEQGT